ncbi:hypothetical protein HPB50_029519 [Hyalomma asiaticum]|nr:hypothetical protein HPB50_029519 [Hyalomma asiaticum]
MGLFRHFAPFSLTSLACSTPYQPIRPALCLSLDSTAEESAYLCMTNSKAGLKRIACELEELLAKPPDQCTAGPVDAGNLYRWQATIEGPQGSPYEGGLFKLRILLPRE